MSDRMLSLDFKGDGQGTITVQLDQGARAQVFGALCAFDAEQVVNLLEPVIKQARAQGRARGTEPAVIHVYVPESPPATVNVAAPAAPAQPKVQSIHVLSLPDPVPMATTVDKRDAFGRIERTTRRRATASAR